MIEGSNVTYPDDIQTQAPMLHEKKRISLLACTIKGINDDTYICSGIVRSGVVHSGIVHSSVVRSGIVRSGIVHSGIVCSVLFTPVLFTLVLFTPVLFAPGRLSSFTPGTI